MFFPTGKCLCQINGIILPSRQRLEIFQFSSTSWRWYPCELYGIQISWSNWRLKVTIHILIELRRLNSKKIKREIVGIRDWLRGKFEVKIETIATYPWIVNLFNWCKTYFIWFFGSMSYVENTRKGDTLWMTPWREKVI